MASKRDFDMMSSVGSASPSSSDYGGYMSSMPSPAAVFSSSSSSSSKSAGGEHRKQLSQTEAYSKLGTKSSALAGLLQWEKRRGDLNVLSTRLRDSLSAHLDTTTTAAQKKERLNVIFNRGILPEFISISKQLEGLCGVERPVDDFSASVLIPNAQNLRSLSNTIKVVPPTSYDIKKTFSETTVCAAANAILFARGVVNKDGLVISATSPLTVNEGEGMSKLNFATKVARDKAAMYLSNCELFPGIYTTIQRTDFGALLKVDEIPNIIVERMPTAAADSSSSSGRGVNLDYENSSSSARFDDDYVNNSKITPDDIAKHNEEIDSILKVIQMELQPKATNRSYQKKS